MPVHPGYVAIKPPLAPPNIFAVWDDPNLPIFIAVGLRDVVETWTHLLGDPFLIPKFPRWILYGGPMLNLHWPAVEQFTRDHFQKKGFTYYSRSVPIAPANIKAWPSSNFSWAWSYETAPSPLFRLVAYPATPLKFVKVA